MNDKEAEIWKKGFESGAKSVERQNEKALAIGRAILDTLYEVFETKKENY